MTAPTGTPITLCTDCNREHPITRQHCPVCGLASLFGHESCGPVRCQCATGVCADRTLPHPGHCCLRDMDDDGMTCEHEAEWIAVHEEICPAAHSWQRRIVDPEQDALPIGEGL